ncbi:hypothetical protein EV401DRAFT_605079 [Pisolithus croceorrhizus]|nr:hypothetical protein EV401DRAFT_605079 [Pisolithus croceorrhizus]
MYTCTCSCLLQYVVFIGSLHPSGKAFPFTQSSSCQLVDHRPRYPHAIQCSIFIAELTLRLALVGATLAPCLFCCSLVRTYGYYRWSPSEHIRIRFSRQWDVFTAL